MKILILILITYLVKEKKITLPKKVELFFNKILKKK